MPLHTVLCPISLSANSGRILRAAANLVQQYGVRLRILHVIDRPPNRVSEQNLLDDFDAARSAVEACILKVVPPSVWTGIERQVEVAEGDVSGEIARRTQDPQVDLAVVGFRRTWHPWTVHSLDRLLRKVQKPVLAIPATGPALIEGRWRQIILATDLTVEAATTHATALTLAEISGAELTVVHVVEGLPPAVAAPKTLAIPEFRSFALQEAHRAMEEAFGSARPDAVRLVLPGGKPEQEIARLAQDRFADLIVVGYRDSHHPLGTLGERLLSQAGCAVLLVPHPAAGRLAHAA